MSLDNGLATLNVGTVNLDWFIEANWCCRDVTIWARLLIIVSVEGLKLDMLDCDWGVALLYVGGGWEYGGETLWYVGMGEDCETNGRITKGGLKEYWLIGSPPWLACVGLTFCVEVVMIKDVNISILGKDVGIGMKWFTWLVGWEKLRTLAQILIGMILVSTMRNST